MLTGFFDVFFSLLGGARIENFNGYTAPRLVPPPQPDWVAAPHKRREIGKMREIKNCCRGVKNVKERLRIFPFRLLASFPPSRVVEKGSVGAIFFSRRFKGVNFYYLLLAICFQMMNTQKVMMSPKQPINYFPFPPPKVKALQII